MTKISALFLLIAAFLYAVWLVLWRRQPDGPGNGRRRLFIFLAVYFMHSLGAPVVAADDAAGGREAGACGMVEEDRIYLPEAFITAWIALGYKARGDVVPAYIDEIGGLWKLREARLEVKRLTEAIQLCEAGLEASWADSTPDPTALEALEKEYQVLALQCSQAKNAVFALLRLQANREGRELDFMVFMRGEAARGKISENAAETLIALFSRLGGHFRQKRATCYLSGYGSSSKSWFDIGAVDRYISGLIGIRDESWYEKKGITEAVLAEYLRQMRLLSLESLEDRLEQALKKNSDGREDEDIARMHGEIAERRAGLDNGDEFLEAASLIVNATPFLPEAWGKQFGWADEKDE